MLNKSMVTFKHLKDHEISKDRQFGNLEIFIYQIFSNCSKESVKGKVFWNKSNYRVEK